MFEQNINAARTDLKAALAKITQEMRDYPTPISGCDAQYNYLIGQRGSINAALRALEAPRFVASPRTQFAGAGVESR